MEHIRVGVIEDNLNIRSSLKLSIELYPAMSFSFEAGSVEQAIEIISEASFSGVDILLLDIGLPGMTGLEGLPHIKQLVPDTDIIMLTTYDDADTVFHALTNGAQSYISKKTPLKEIMESIFIVHRGGSYMSPSIARKLITHIGKQSVKNEHFEKLSGRQYSIVENLSQGLTYKNIAEKLGISLDTVRSHIKNIYKCLEINSKIELVKMYNQAD